MPQIAQWQRSPAIGNVGKLGLTAGARQPVNQQNCNGVAVALLFLLKFSKLFEIAAYAG
jgi:hypothetical protein